MPHSVAAPRDLSSGTWQPLGPSPLASDASGTGQQDYGWVSGRATAVAIDPADATGNTVFLGGAYGGLWKSGNAGSNSSDPANVAWQPLIDDQPSLSVGAVAIQPGNSNPAQSVVLVGTGETNSSTDSYYGEGVLRSADGGATWAPMIQQDVSTTHSFLGLGFSQFAFNTANPKQVIAATAGTSEGELEGLQNPVSANLGLYESNDGGVSWNYATVKDGARAVDPGSATAVVYNAAAQEFFAVLRFHGFYSSTDGVNWARLASQPGGGLTAAACPPSPASENCPIYRGVLAVVPGRSGPNNLGEMYAWYVDLGNNDQGMWRSTDAGASWEPIDESGITNCGDLIGGCGTQDGTYNLTLAAVPDGATATDLYAGAVNLFKCVISQTFPSCSPAGNPPPPPTATFRNLTHVYGCNPLAAIAHVHPSQHGMDFLVNAAGQSVMYFANDGGIYRALDGYSDLISGDCAIPNHFDDLSGTLGSMTQFISLAQHPGDANTLLGGAQGNGSPATAASLVSQAWAEVNGGDGGYSAINPVDPEEWFTANTGVSIQSCEAGIGCRAPDFSNSVIVSSATLGGDGGPLYTPYLLDPQDSSVLLVGTCRVWRGTTSGSGFAPLSSNFETGSDAVCTGSELNTVRALAAGGEKDGNGFSNVIYAGTSGTGPLAPAPGGGHLWVTTNAVAGAAAWSDRTSAINPQHFPVSGIALDPADPSGATAYVTLMGFGGSHVWQTTNAGQTWTDFTANLPSAPVNAILVNDGTVYLGSDVGVFASTTSVANWAEVGPAPLPGGGQSGFLPDVPVMALTLFDNGVTRLLRAATYGRGVWQFPLTTTPDFQLALPDPTQTAFAGQSAQFSGAVSAFNGYGSMVALSCMAGTTPPPQTCSFTPGSLTPGALGTSFTLTAAGPVGDYSFEVHGMGADGTAHDIPLTLHVVDFTLGPPTPAAVAVQPGQSSSAITMQVGFEGSFPSRATVDLSCASQTGISCSFAPNASVSPADGNPVSVSLEIGASSDTPVNSYNVTISATSSVADAKTESQTLGLNVVIPSYTVTANAPAATPVAVNETLTGKITASNGYNTTVQLSCVAAGSSSAPPTCGFTPPSVVPSATGAAFTLTVGSNAAGTFLFDVQGMGTDGALEATASPLALTVYDFSITSDNAPPVNAGQTATYDLVFSPLPASTTFMQNVGGLACSGLPALSSCSFAPSQIASGSPAETVTLQISTTGPVARVRSSPLFYCALGLPVFGAIAVFPWVRRRNRTLICALALALMLTALQPACSSGLSGNGGGKNPQPGTPPGSYMVTITALEGPLQHQATVTLTVQ